VIIIYQGFGLRHKACIVSGGGDRWVGVGAVITGERLVGCVIH